MNHSVSAIVYHHPEIVFKEEARKRHSAARHGPVTVLCGQLIT